MKLIIGGYAQGKLKVACQSVPEKKKIIWDGTLWESSVGNGEQLIINHFHEWVKTCLRDYRGYFNCTRRASLSEMKLGMELFR